jgi:hypothetical protein
MTRLPARIAVLALACSFIVVVPPARSFAQDAPALEMQTQPAA